MLVASLWVGAFLLAAPAYRDATVLSILVAAAITLAWVPYIRKRLGSLTGDTLGALNEFTEILVLALFAIRIA